MMRRRAGAAAAALAVALLLSGLAAPPGAPPLGALADNLRWGATGDFAGFQGYMIAYKQCNWRADQVQASQPAVYAGISQSCKFKSAMTRKNIWVNGFGSDALAYSLMGVQSLLVAASVAGRVTTMVEKVREIECLICGSPKEAGCAQPKRQLTVVSSVPATSAAVAPLVVVRDAAANGRRLLKARGPRYYASVQLFTTTLNLFLGTIRDIANVLRRLPFRNNRALSFIPKFADKVYTLFDSPLQSVKRVDGKIVSMCDESQKMLNKADAFVDKVKLVSSFLTVLRNGPIVALSYTMCSEHNALVDEAVGMFSRNETLETCSDSRHRRRLLSDPLEASEADLYALAKKAEASVTKISSLIEDAYQVVTGYMPSLNAVTDAIETEVEALDDAVEMLRDLVDAQLNIPSVVMDILKFFSSLFGGNFDPCDGFVGSLLCESADAFSSLMSSVLPDAIRDIIDDIENKIVDLVFSNLPSVPRIFSEDYIKYDLISLPSVVDLRGKIENMTADFKAKADQLMASAYQDLVPNGVVLLSGALADGVDQRMALSHDPATVVLSCPLTWRAYVTDAKAFRLPDCNADLTSFVRFPCTPGATVDDAGKGRTYCSIDYVNAMNVLCTQPPSAPKLGGFMAAITVQYKCVKPGTTSFRLLPQLDTFYKLKTAAGAKTQTDLPRISYNTSRRGHTEEAMRAALAEPAPSSDFTNAVCTSAFTPKSLASPTCPASYDLATGCSPGFCKPGYGRQPTFDAFVNPTAEQQALAAVPGKGPSFYSRASGLLYLEGVADEWHDRSATYPSKTCSGAASFGLPSLLVEAVDFDICYHDKFTRSFYGDNNQAYLASDYCAWRFISRLGPLQGDAKFDYKDLLASMSPPMLLPWNATPGDADFRDWWVSRGACEFFESPDGTQRSSWGGLGWKSRTLTTASQCASAVTRPTCTKVTVNGTNRWDCAIGGALWPLVDHVADPATSKDQWSWPRKASSTYRCGLPKGVSPYNADGSFGGGDPTPIDLRNGGTAIPGCSCVGCPTPYICTDCNRACTLEAGIYCYIDRERESEYNNRMQIHNQYNYLKTVTDMTIPAGVQACNLTQGTCNLNTIFAPASGGNDNIGGIQTACVESSVGATTSGGNSTTVTYVFFDSLNSFPKAATCFEHQQLVFNRAELGQGTTIRSVLSEVIQYMCDPSGRRCVIDIMHPVLGAGKGDVLRFEHSCACGPGYEILPDATGSCTPCGNGYYRDNTTAECTPAPKGYYAAGNASTQATPCPPGSFGLEEGVSYCYECPYKTYSTAVGSSSNDTCIPCTGVNSYTNGTGATACLECPEGFVIQDSNSDAELNHCSACPPGSFRTLSMDSCEMCPAGTYNSQYASTNCSKAAKGYYVPAAGYQAAIPCNYGFYQPDEGKKECIACADGLTTYDVAATSASACLAAVALVGSSYADLVRDMNATGPGACESLIRKWYNGTTNYTTVLESVGDGFCSRDILNSRACLWDGGDCCPSTCNAMCVQTSTDSTGSSYQVLLGSCTDSTFQCKDPAAQGQPARPLNCTGTRVSGVSLQEQLKVAAQNAASNTTSSKATDRVTTGTSEVADSIGNGICDPSLNNANNSWDGGDCCPATCRSRRGVATCTTFDCLHPSWRFRGDVIPPKIWLTPGSTFAINCSREVLPAVQVGVSDNSDSPADISVEGPYTYVYNTMDPAALNPQVGKPMPCVTDTLQYMIVLVWNATDRAGNSALTSQVVYVWGRADREPPKLTVAPATKVANCSSVVYNEGFVGVTVTDNVDPLSTLIPLLVAPVISSAEPGVAFGQPLPCPGYPYNVSVTWGASDSSGNTATVTQTISVVEYAGPYARTPIVELYGSSSRGALSLCVAGGARVAVNLPWGPTPGASAVMQPSWGDGSPPAPIITCYPDRWGARTSNCTTDHTFTKAGQFVPSVVLTITSWLGDLLPYRYTRDLDAVKVLDPRVYSANLKSVVADLSNVGYTNPSDLASLTGTVKLKMGKLVGKVTALTGMLAGTEDAATNSSGLLLTGSVSVKPPGSTTAQSYDFYLWARQPGSPPVTQPVPATCSKKLPAHCCSAPTRVLSGPLLPDLRTSLLVVQAGTYLPYGPSIAPPAGKVLYDSHPTNYDIWARPPARTTPPKKTEYLKITQCSCA